MESFDNTTLSDDTTFDRMMREKEFLLKERELDIKARDYSRGWIVNALTVGVLAGVLGLFANIWSSHALLEQEKRKDEAALMLDAMKAPTIDERCTNLLFLESAGLTEAAVQADAICTGTAVYHYFARSNGVQLIEVKNSQVTSAKWYSVIVAHVPVLAFIGAVVLAVWVASAIGSTVHYAVGKRKNTRKHRA